MSGSLIAQGWYDQGASTVTPHPTFRFACPLAPV